MAAAADDSIPEPYTTTSTRDTLILHDTTIIIHTVCAPICPSVVLTYDSNGQQIGTIQPPFTTPFPEAYIEDNRLLWRDNMPQMLDETERKYRTNANQ